MTAVWVPELDDELRQRLARRFGPSVETWLDDLPPVLADLAGRWQVELHALIRRGSVSVVIRGRTANGEPVVLKISPERRRIADEGAALGRWRTTHVPSVLAVDEHVGALLVEAIEPGTPLADATAYPRLDDVAALLASLHAGPPDPSYPPLAARIAYLFDAGRRNYERRPDLAAVVPPELYERGRGLALELAADSPRTTLLHGDLTPANVLDGGPDRGLVAIDPTPCLGDPAFDAVDLLVWRAVDAQTVFARAERLAGALRADAERMVGWCTAFAAMTALEIAEGPDPDPERVRMLVALAGLERT